MTSSAVWVWHLLDIVALALLPTVLLAAIAIDRLLRGLARRRRARLESLQIAIAALLADEPHVPLRNLVAAALERIARILEADRAWLTIGEDVDGFHGWSGGGPLDRARTAAELERATDRFPWTGDVILVAPGGSVAVPWHSCVTGRRATRIEALFVRLEEREGEALLCVAGRPSFRVHYETVQGLATLLLVAVHLDRRRRLEADRTALVRDLAVGRRMETIGSLASGVAHNMNNIVAAIGGFAGTAAARVPRGSPEADAIRGIGDAVERARSLVAEILRFGRRVEGPPERLDLNDLLAETSRLVSVSLPTGVGLRCKAATVPVRVAADFGQLQQVLLNLCSNAAKAMPGGGILVCETAVRILEDPIRLSHGALRRGHYATLAVEDEGCGIARDAIPLLFEAFYSNRPGGTGLGLSTAYRTVTGHGGAIDVDSVPGAGSRFTVWLPLADEQLDTPTELRLRRGAGETVLIVNPEEARLSRDEELLAALGYEPIGVADSAQIELIEGPIDAVLVAGIDQQRVAEFAEHAKTAYRSVPVLVAVPEPGEDGARLRYPLQPAKLAIALSRVLPLDEDEA